MFKNKKILIGSIIGGVVVLLGIIIFVIINISNNLSKQASEIKDPQEQKVVTCFENAAKDTLNDWKKEYSTYIFDDKVIPCIVKEFKSFEKYQIWGVSKTRTNQFRLKVAGIVTQLNKDAKTIIEEQQKTADISKIKTENVLKAYDELFKHNANLEKHNLGTQITAKNSDKFIFNYLNVSEIQLKKWFKTPAAKPVIAKIKSYLKATKK